MFCPKKAEKKTVGGKIDVKNAYNCTSILKDCKLSR